MTDPSAYKRRHCATCRELDLDGDGDDLDDDGNCMDCVAAAVEDDEDEVWIYLTPEQRAVQQDLANKFYSIVLARMESES